VRQSGASAAGGATKCCQRVCRVGSREVLAAEGFEQLPTEWWHFDYRGWQRYPLADVPLRGGECDRSSWYRLGGVHRTATDGRALEELDDVVFGLLDRSDRFVRSFQQAVTEAVRRGR